MFPVVFGVPMPGMGRVILRSIFETNGMSYRTLRHQNAPSALESRFGELTVLKNIMTWYQILLMS